MKHLIPFFLLIIFTLTSCSITKPDTTPPEIQILQPLDGAIIQDSVLIIVETTDRGSVEKVEFFIEDSLLFVANSAPYECWWFTEDLQDGVYNIQCKATDQAENESTCSIDVNVTNTIFTAHIHNSWLEDLTDCILVISDQDGTLLDSEEINYANTYTFCRPAGYNGILESLIVTAVMIYDLYFPGIYYITLTSDTAIPVLSEYTYKYFVPAESISEVELTFTNIPDHMGHRFSTTGYWENNPQNLEPEDTYFIDINTTPDNLLVELNVTDPFYYWFENIEPGSYEFDLSQPSEFSVRNLDFPSLYNWVNINTIGFLGGSDYAAGGFTIDFTHDFIDPGEPAQLIYPEGIFSNYYLYFSHYDYVDGDSYTNVSFGELPDAIEFLDADLCISDLNNNTLEFDVSGDCDMVTSNWYMPECFQTMFYWYINSSPEACVHSIVEFPTFLTERFPELAGGDFELQDARLIKYENMNSYDDYLEVIYSPDEYFFSTFIDYRERRYNYLNSRQNENIVPNRLLRR